MDVHYQLNDCDFIWNLRKAASNPGKHDGVTFEQAATVFLDPLFRLVDAGRNDEESDAVIGFDAASRLLFIVHVEHDDARIRIISARRATSHERQDHEHF